MTEQQPTIPEATPPAPSGDPLPTPAPAPDPTPDPEVKATRSRKSAAADDHGTRYCVYNLTLTQFVGPVVDVKPTATEAKKLVPKGHDVEVREV